MKWSLLKTVTGGAHYTWADIAGFASSFISSVVNFIIMAFILFCLMKAINTAANLGKKKENTAPTTKICPFCKSEIPIDAVKCAHCTTELPQE